MAKNDRTRYRLGDPRNAARMMRDMDALRAAREGFIDGFREAAGHDPTPAEVDAFMVELEAKLRDE